jgi:hypothetical protein
VRGCRPLQPLTGYTDRPSSSEALPNTLLKPFSMDSNVTWGGIVVPCNTVFVLALRHKTFSSLGFVQQILLLCVSCCETPRTRL